MDEALDAVFLCLLEEDACADDIGGVDVFGRIEGEGGSGVDDDVRASHTLANYFTVADIALGEGDLIPLGVGEIDKVNAGDVFIAVGAQVAHKVDAQKAADTADIDFNGNLLCQAK